jgi:hypothetical protein
MCGRHLDNAVFDMSATQLLGEVGNILGSICRSLAMIYSIHMYSRLDLDW